TNTTGDPTGGDQKTNPCGVGTVPTNVVTTLNAGQSYTVSWTETVGHPGWWRIALARNRADLPAPVAADTACSDAGVLPIGYPILGDRLLFSPVGQTGATKTQNITVPNTGNCANCTLQVVQFMLNHGP